MARSARARALNWIRRRRRADGVEHRRALPGLADGAQGGTAAERLCGPRQNNISALGASPGRFSFRARTKKFGVDLLRSARRPVTVEAAVLVERRIRHNLVFCIPKYTPKFQPKHDSIAHAHFTGWTQRQYVQRIWSVCVERVRPPSSSAKT